MPTVWFIDTCVLTNILNLDGYNQDHSAIMTELKQKVDSGDTLILPVTAIIETGNHIAHHGNGFIRRQVAEKFSQILAQIRDGVAPWRLHAIQWDYSFLDALISGASTNVSLVDHATSQVGCGDLCIIAERDVYRENSGIADVRIWSIDDHLHAHG